MARLVSMSFTASTKVMNINKTLNLLVLVLVLMVQHAVCAPQESNQAPRMSKEQMVSLETNIARAVVWQLYWCEGKTSAQLRKLISESRPMSYTLCRVEHEDLCVYLDAYQWKVVLTKIGSEHYGFDVEDYKMLAGDAADHRRDYLEALKNEPAVLSKGTLTLRPEHLSVLAFDKPNEPRYRLVTNLVKTNLLDSNWLKKDMAANKVRGPLTVHIGGFTGQSPWIYYRVEGMPYVGMMLVNPSTMEFIHDDFLYVHENSREPAYENIELAIDRSGTKFSLNLPKQTKAEGP